MITTTAPLEATTIRRMCTSCARSANWSGPATALGIFLRALTGYDGLLDRLSEYHSGYLDEDFEGRDVARAAELLRAAEWPDDEDEDLSDEYDEARNVRDELVRYFWCHAAESLYRVSRVIGQYPWLADWARSRVEAKAEYAEELRRMFASFIQPERLVDAAAVELMPEPPRTADSERLVVLGDAEKVVRKLWRDWQHRASTSWKRLEDHTDPVWTVLHDAMGNRRKGRDEAEQALRELIEQWITAARSSVEAAKSADRRWLVAIIPDGEGRREHSRQLAFDSIMTDWHLAVLAVFAKSIDWSRRVALLHVPEPIARRLMDGDTELLCHEIGQPTGEPRVVLASWVEQNLAAPEAGILPGVLDDTPISQRRIVRTSDVVALQDTDMGDLPYLVFSAEAGVEVLQPPTVAKRAAAGWRGVIVAGPADVPESLIGPWADELMSSATDDDDDRLDPLGIRAGERSLVSPRAGRQDVEFILRMLAIVRAAPDLRAVGGEPDSSQRTVPWRVWRALLSPQTLDVNPFLPPEARSPFHEGGLALPLSILAPIQLYTTNLDPVYGKGHSPYCAHARGYGERVDFSFALFSFADLVRLSSTDWCSKCGGYAVRRLTDAQLDYYRSASRLLHIHDDIVRYESDSGFFQPTRESTESIVDELGDLQHRFPDAEANPFGSEADRWRTAVLDLRGRAIKLLPNLG